MNMENDTESVYDRTSIKMPDFRRRKISSQYDYESAIVDYEDLDKLNSAINQALVALFKASESINYYSRLEIESKTKYDRAWRREYLKSTAKTDSEKKHRANLMCEDLENEWLVHHQTKEELTRFSHALRIELDTLQSLGNNMRQQMRVV